MEPEQLLHELLRVARAAGVEVRSERVETRPRSAGGLCWVHGAPIVIVDPTAPRLDALLALARSLSTFDLRRTFMRPAVRAFIFDPAARAEFARSTAPAAGGQETGTLVHPHKPGLRTCGR